MKNLNDWSARDLLALYQRIEEHVAPNEEPLLVLEGDDPDWQPRENAEGDRMALSADERQLLLFVTGREHDGNDLVFHLYSIAGPFRTLIKAKVEEAIPAPPKQWYNYLAAYRTKWKPEDKGTPNERPKSSKIRSGARIKESPVPFPKGNMSEHDDPPF
jgi:hypothetical protein